MASYADATRSYPGAVNNDTGTYAKDNALFKDIFTGEVLAAFDETNIFKPLTRLRQITKGKSASFGAIGKATSKYHVPGTPVLGSNQFKHNEIVIKVDDLLLADAFVYELDELKTAVDVRMEYSKQLGAALARTFDQKLARVLVLASRATTPLVTGGNTGGMIKNTAAATDGEVLASMIFKAAQKLDENDVDEMDRYCAVKPAQYYLMAESTKLINKDWGGSGVYADGKILRVAGVALVKTNNVPSTDLSSGGVTGENNYYTGNFTDTVGIVFNRQAAGTVQLMDVVTQVSGPDFEIMYQGTLLVAKMAVGHGILRPDCAIELSKSA